MKLKSNTVTFLVAFIVWLMLTFNLELPSVLAGLFVALLVSLTTGHLFTEYPSKWKQPKRYFYFFVYIAVFLRECIKSNIDVALRVVQPSMPINPGIVKVKTRLKSEASLTALANTITLTPGTFTVDIDAQEGTLYIHWIYVKEKDMVQATNIIVKQFEDIIERVFE